MAEPIDELSVRLTADGVEFLDDVDRAVERGKKSLEELPEAADAAAQALQGPLREAATNVLETADLLGISLENAAENLSVMAMGMEFSAQELAEAARIMEAETTAVVESAVQRIVQAASDGGVELSENQVENYRQFFQTIIDQARRVESEGPRIMQSAVEQIAQAGEEAAFRFGDVQRQIIEDYLEDVDSIGQHMPPARSAIDQFTGSVETQMQTLGQAQQTVGLLGGIIQQFAFQVVGALGIIALLNEARKIVSQAVDDALALEEANFRLAAAVRVQQEAQGSSAGTFREWRDVAKSLVDEFGRPLETTMIDVAASMNLMARNTDLTGDQMQTLLRHGTATAAVFSRELDPTMRKFVNFIQTGARESLDDLGVTITDMALRQAAADLGLQQSLDTLSEAQMQQVRYQAVLNQTAGLIEVAGERTETFGGRQEKANQKMRRASQIIGRMFLPAMTAFKEILATAALAGAQLIFVLTSIAVQLNRTVVGAFVGAAAAAGEFFNQLQRREFDPDAVMDAFTQEVQRAQEQGKEALRTLAENFDGFGDRASKQMDQVGDEARAMQAMVDDAFDESAEAVEDATRRWEEGLADAQQRLEDRLEDINQDVIDKTADLRTDLQRDLADIDRDAIRDRAEAIRDAQVEEIRARVDHARAVRELERQFAFDITDAVRERDARRVLDLRRRFRSERQRLDEEFDLRQKRREEDLRLELEAIERRRRLRREERILQFKEELQDLAIQAKRRRRDARQRYQRELRDLRKNIERRLALVAQGLSGELQLTAEGLNQLYQMLQEAYGSGGWVEAFYRRYAQIIAQAGQVTGAIGGDMAAGQGVFDELKTRRISTRQRGGTLMAVSPTELLVGEGRPERIDITPLSQSTGRPLGSGASPMGGRAVIEVKVDADEKLMVSVADFVENDIADVMLSVNQGAGRQARGAFR